MPLQPGLTLHDGTLEQLSPPVEPPELIVYTPSNGAAGAEGVVAGPLSSAAAGSRTSTGAVGGKNTSPCFLTLGSERLHAPCLLPVRSEAIAAAAGQEAAAAPTEEPAALRPLADVP